MSESENKYRIGEFVFDTFHEYRDGQEDLQKIELINKELDVHDPKVAVRLYNMIKTGEIVFKSPIGDQFFAHVADIVADKSQGLIKVNDAVDEAEGKMKKEKIIGYVVIGLAIIFFAYFGVSEISDVITARKQAKWADLIDQNTDSSDLNKAILENDDGSSTYNPDGVTIDRSALVVLPEYLDLYNQNNDLVGWLHVEGTDINYPVCQKANDNEYYLKHSFDNKDDNNGTLFVDYRSDIVNQTTNTLIYGHNMKNGMMFGQLKKYQDKQFLEEHRIINFDTIYEKRTYQIIAVGLSEVKYKDDNSYRYYNFINAQTQTQLDAFKATVEGLSIYDEKLDISLEDKLLTLSTCNSYTDDGRLFVVAKRIK